MMDTIFKGLDRIMQFIPGSAGAGARERIAASDKADATAAPKSSEISVPKNPAPSTIASPSASPATAKGESTAPVAAAPTTPSRPGKEKETGTGDINSQMESHNSLLEQLLSVMHNSVSVNKDILRYTKNQA